MANTYNNIATILEELGKVDEAEKCYENSLKLRLVILGENHSDTASSYNNIGNLLQQKNKTKDALKHYESSLRIQIALHGEEHLEVSRLRLLIALMHLKLGNPYQALHHCQLAYDISVRLLG